MATLRVLCKANFLRQERTTIYEHLAWRSDFPPEAHAPLAQNQRPASWNLGAPTVPVPILQIGTVQRPTTPQAHSSWRSDLSVPSMVDGTRSRSGAPHRNGNQRPATWHLGAPRIPVPILQIGTVQPATTPQAHSSWRSDLNQRPAVYETAALPLSYASI
jgi:hypothetical protein